MSSTATAPPLADSIEIAAPPAAVWPLVSDVCRMSEWSPQVTSTRLRSGFDEVALGAEFTNRNHYGELEWTTHAKVVRYEPEQALAFRVEENWQVWTFELAVLDGGRTLLTQRRDAPDGLSDLSLQLTEGFMGGVESFTATMRAGMRETLEAIKVAAEG